ncbi:beta-ketoacyl-ACP reductase [candidate division KSB1 bacterium]|nr:MAG: beta-ketoacyl-ACP reductase [candidate division KSB1 bacterium]
MTENLKNKVAIITGAARGIGREIAITLATEGADISICDIDTDGLSKTAEEIKSSGRKVFWLKTDVSREDDVKKAVDKTVEEFGRIDILVNNAGITKDNLLIRMSEDEWNRVIDVNLKSVFLFTKYAGKYMMKGRYGKIVNISSVVGIMGNAGQANYSASKAGIIGLTKTSARELAARNITVNAVAPGFIQTEMTKNLPDNVKEMFLKNVPLKRMGYVKDIANAVRFLVSPESDYITGQVIQVDGGLLM